MNAFHMYWNPSQEERKFSDYTILMLILSVMQWKNKNSGKLSFYGDAKTVNFLERLHINELWDRCDGVTLDQKIDKKHYNVLVFYSIGKFIALLQEPCPCAMLDIDLVIWENLDSLLKEKDAVFTHWEDTKETSIWYCDKKKLPVPEKYQFNPVWDFKKPAANTSFIYFNNSSLRDYYAECAMRYMWDNPYAIKETGNAAILFAEQRLFTMCVDERNCWDKMAPLIDITWDAKKGEFRLSQNTPNGWAFFQPDNESVATHIWIAKEQIDKNEQYRSYFCCRLIEKLRNIDCRIEKILVTIPSIQPYLKLLDSYESTSKMLKKGIITKKLYP